MVKGLRKDNGDGSKNIFYQIYLDNIFGNMDNFSNSKFMLRN